MSNIAHKGKREEQNENQSLQDEGQAKHLQAQKKHKKPLKQRGTSFVLIIIMIIILANKTHPTHIQLFLPVLPPDDSPPNGDDNGFETNNVQEFETKIYKEYAAAQDHEGIHKYTNVTIEEILMGNSLQQITFSSFCY